MSPATTTSRKWMLALSFVLLVLAIDSVRRFEHISICTNNDMKLPLLLPESDSSSPTGCACGQRQLILPPGGWDGYHFVMQTQHRLTTGAWRTRHVSYDNYPKTREVHWASLLSWILEATAWCDSLASGRTLGLSIERVAPYAHTLFFVGTLLTLVPLAARRFGSKAASVLALGLLFVSVIYDNFLVGHLDHHGLIATFAMMSVMLLLAGGAGWVRDTSSMPNTAEASAALARWLPNEAGARRWFAAAAWAGGAALWLSGATQIPILVGLGLGMLLSSLMSSTTRNPESSSLWRHDPMLWRFWSRVGAGASCFFYLLEYFPSEMGLRLEVNHPLYALAWLGGGELLFLVGRCLREGKRIVSPWTALTLTFSLATLAAVPLVMWFCPDSFVLQDPFLQSMTSDFVQEGQPLWRALTKDLTLPKWVLFNCLPVLGLLEIWLLCRTRLQQPYRGIMVIALAPCLVVTILAVLHVRWLGICMAIWLVNLTSLLWILGHAGVLTTWKRKTAVALFVLFVLLPGLQHLCKDVLVYVLRRPAGTYLTSLDPYALTHLEMRDVAFRLRKRIGNEKGAVLTGLTNTTILLFHSSLPGVGTLYWENLVGLKAAGAIYGATAPEQAFELLQSRNITHLVLFPFDLQALEYARLHHGVGPTAPLPADFFAVNLLGDAKHPPWLRPIHMPAPKHDIYAGRRIIAFEFMPHQSAREAALRWAQLRHRERHTSEAERRLNELLSQHPGYLAALTQQALVVSDLRKMSAFHSLLDQIKENMEQAKELDLEDRLNLVTVLDRAKDHDEARRQLAGCLQQADEKSLRRLDDAALIELLQYTREYQLQKTWPENFEVGIRLLPLNEQKRFRE